MIDWLRRQLGLTPRRLTIEVRHNPIVAVESLEVSDLCSCGCGKVQVLAKGHMVVGEELRTDLPQFPVTLVLMSKSVEALGDALNSRATEYALRSEYGDADEYEEDYSDED